jgi:hypothetical protein
MKLRIRGNSIRLRLLKTEVAELAEKGSVSESVEFGPDNELRYSVRTGADNISASFEDNEVTILIPEAEVSAWADDEEKVGIEAQSNGLHILIEKDFACLTRNDDPDNLDAYPNPELDCT